MDPMLEIRPAECLFLVGPQLTRNSLDSEKLSYKSVIKSGLAFLLEQGIKYEGQLMVEELVESSPVNAMEWVVKILQTSGHYVAWMKRIFRKTEQKRIAIPDSVVWLLQLQQMGAMLACTQYDTTLDNISDTKPVTFSCKDGGFVEWLASAQDGNQIESAQSERCSKEEKTDVATGNSVEELDNVDNAVKKPGFLHLHGVQTQTDSINLLPYYSLLGKTETDSRDVVEDKLAALRNVFHNKLVFLVGFDGEDNDPLLPSLLHLLYPDGDTRALKNLPILLTSSQDATQLFPDSVRLLHLKIKSIDCLREVLILGTPKNFYVGKDYSDKQGHDEVKVQAFLLFNEKQSFRKLGDVIYQQSKSGEIYVRRDALTVIFDNNKILYGNLVTYGGNGLQKLWGLVFTEGSTLLGKGLVALGFQSAVIVWINGKPKGLNSITGINSVHTTAAHKAIHNMSLSQKSPFSTYSSESLSHCKPPPFYTPVPATSPTLPSVAETAGNESPVSPSASTHLTSPTTREGDNSLSSDRPHTSRLTNVGNLVSPNAIPLSPPVPTAVPTAVPIAANPLPYALIPGLTGAAGGGVSPHYLVNILGNQIVTAIPPRTSFPIPTPLPSTLPNSVPFSIPTSIPFPVPITSHSMSPVMSSNIVSQTDLEALRNIHNRINMELSSMPSEKETSETPVSSSSYSVDSIEQRVSLSLKSNFTLCTAEHAKMLYCLPTCEEWEKTLAKHEHIIKRVDLLENQPHTIECIDTHSFSDSLKITDAKCNLSILTSASQGKCIASVIKDSSSNQPGKLTDSTSHVSLASIPFLSPFIPLSVSNLSLPPLRLSSLNPFNATSVPSTNQPMSIFPTTSSKTPTTVISLFSPISAPVMASPSSVLTPTTATSLFSPISATRLASFSSPTSLTSSTSATSIASFSSATSLTSSSSVTSIASFSSATNLASSSSATSSSSSVSILASLPRYPTSLPGTSSVPLLNSAVFTGSISPYLNPQRVPSLLTRAGIGQLPGSSSSPLCFMLPSSLIPVMEPVPQSGTEISGTMHNRKRHNTLPGLSASKILKLPITFPPSPYVTLPLHVQGTTTDQNHPRWSGNVILPPQHVTSSPHDKKDVSFSSESPETKTPEEVKGQLWQFLLDLLLTPNHSTLIQWTGNENEFKIVDVPAMAALWETHKQSVHGSSEELLSALTLCCSNGILNKIEERTMTFSFLVDIQRYILDNKFRLAKISL